MKKVLLVISGGLATLGVQQTAVAGPLAPVVHKGNSLRAQAWCLNQQAGALEHKVAIGKRYYGVNAVGMSLQARDLRRQAKMLAKKSNRVALAAFDSGYIRPGYSAIY
ncbi:MAG: hypothetical protein WAQ53_13785 [Thiofilum sp.]|uniref:hypothetical protein n=1 Tax=Thiofilum sp. TaxID=2212733 RepID=UPI0025D0BD90|nr:hypothetical protein [Thiofilum sp.]MBK8453974.1 hypothetical protein [Thiofilum sp.]